MVPVPTSEDVRAYLNWSGFPDAEVEATLKPHVEAVTTLARSYTRGVGFTDTECEEDLREVIISATVRSALNPEQTNRVEIASYNEMPAVFQGWTLIELAVLHNYRRRAA